MCFSCVLLMVFTVSFEVSFITILAGFTFDLFQSVLYLFACFYNEVASYIFSLITDRVSFVVTQINLFSHCKCCSNKCIKRSWSSCRRFFSLWLFFLFIILIIAWIFRLYFLCLNTSTNLFRESYWSYLNVSLRF